VKVFTPVVPVLVHVQTFGPLMPIQAATGTAVPFWSQMVWTVICCVHVCGCGHTQKLAVVLTLQATLTSTDVAEQST
jgi:hypothetical protein